MPANIAGLEDTRMKRFSLFTTLLLLLSAAALAAATPPTSLDFLSSDPANIAAFKAPDHDAALKAQMVLLNNNGGIPFYNMTTRRYQRVRQPASEPDKPVPVIANAEQHFMANRDVFLLQLAPGKRFLVFSHSSSPVTGATTIWEVGARYPALRLAFTGELDSIRRRPDGNLVLVFSDITCKVEVLYNPAGNTLTPVFAMALDEACYGSPIYPEGAVKYEAPRQVRIRAAAGTPLYAEPSQTSKVIARTPLSAAWTLASLGDWRLMLVPVRVNDWWLNVFAGNTWKPVWVQSSSLIE